MHKLASKEKEDLALLAKKLNISTDRLIASQKIYNSFEKEFKKDPLLHKIYKDIQNRLGYTPLIPPIPISTKEIHNPYKASLHLIEQRPIPIQFLSQHSTYSLWKLLRAPSQEIHPGLNSYVVVYLTPLLTLKFPLCIRDILYYPTETLIKISHSCDITTLTKRKNLRIDIQAEGFIKKKGKLQDNPFYKCKVENISKEGVKISMDFAPFEEKDMVEVNTKLDQKKIYLTATILKKLPYNCYSVRFNNIDKHTQSIIERFVHKYS